QGRYSESWDLFWTRTTSNPLPGAFSLPWVLCLILGALLFLVLVILVTQLLRWRAERRALPSYEDSLPEAVYEDLDHVDDEDNNDHRSAPGNRGGPAATECWGREFPS
ncbi:hypothetical protein FD755_023284, partial [Muntiacus reevesi]